MKTKNILNAFSAVMFLLCAPIAKADEFHSYNIRMEYSSAKGELQDLENAPRTIRNPTIARKELADGVEFIFSQNGETLARVKKLFVVGIDMGYVDEFPQITAHGQTSAVFADLSLQTAPQSQKELCSYAKDLNKFQRLLKTNTNRIYHNNSGGLGNIGVCWWFSRLERNSAYLTFYSPRKAKPSHQEAVRLLAQIRSGKNIVEIPGYENFRQFTEDFAQEVQSNLNSWQVSDGIFGGGWMHGLQGQSEISAQDLRKIMDDTYKSVVQEKKITYHMLQMPGVMTTHAWLVLGMTKNKDGYTLQLADSNDTNHTRLLRYTNGMTHFIYARTYKTVPYLQSSYAREGDRVIQTLQNACGLK